MIAIRLARLAALALFVTGCASKRQAPAPVAVAEPAPSIAAPQKNDEPLSGIGIRPILHARGFAVGQLFPGSNAERAGLKVGDVVLRVDGASTAHFTLDDVVAHLRGRPGSTVTLDVDRGKAPVRLTITRALLNVPPLPQ